ncbi:MAG: plasmid replication protein RepC-5b [Cereibacter sp.]|jgi:replication initiation protein RepC|nr:plasmid replication protein RepC-5b [Cereibacter sp.]
MSFQRAYPQVNPANGFAVPGGGADPIWNIYRTLRDAASAFGLKPKVMQTLAALLSCLKPGKGTICFASNNELQRRLAGVSDKTIRRHIAELAAAGVLQRHDSPNGKRYSSRDPLSGEVEAYGIDLSPMIQKAPLWESALAELDIESGRIRHCRTKLLARLARIDAHGDIQIDTDAIRKILRRKSVTCQDIEGLLDAAEKALGSVEDSALPSSKTAATADPSEQPQMSASGGQNDRDHSMSETEDKETDCSQANGATTSTTVGEVLGKLHRACNDAMQFALEPIGSWQGIHRHAKMLAPMIGIDQSLIEAARMRLGDDQAALSIIAMVQLQPRVRNMQAYFRSLITGRRSKGFNVARLLDKLEMSSMCR